MGQRLRFNSDSIRSAFVSEYEALFKRCPIVASAPGTFYWCGEHVVLYGGPALIQKLPVRAYVGFEPSNRRGVNFAPWAYYVPAENAFRREQFPVEEERRLKMLLTGLIDNARKGENKPGLVAHILIEFPVGCGLNSSGSIGAAGAAALGIVTRQLSDRDIVGWQDRPVCELANDKAFDRTFRTAWKMEAAIHGGTSSGGGAFGPFGKAGYYPIIYGTAARRGTANSPRGTLPPVNVESRYDLIDSIPYWAAGFDEVFGTDAQWPVDFGLIFSGEAKFTSEVTRGMVSSRQQRAENSAQALAALRPYIGSAAGFLIDFVKQPSDESRPSDRQAYDEWWGSLVDFGSFLCLEIIWGLDRGFAMQDAESVEHLLDSINAFQQLLSIMGASESTLDALIAKVREFAEEQYPRSAAAVKSSGAGRSGDLLFVVPRRRLLGRQDELMASLGAERSRRGTPYLDYISWEDGIGSEGLRLEQDFEGGIYSEFVPKGSLRLTVAGETASVQIISPDEVSSLVAAYDVFVDLRDADHGQLFIGGSKLTSHDVKTASRTAEIIREVIGRQNETISWRDLPGIENSSYAEPDQFRSKIMSPLKKEVSERVGCELGLELSCSKDEFWVRYRHTSKPTIAVLEMLV